MMNGKEAPSEKNKVEYQDFVRNLTTKYKDFPKLAAKDGWVICLPDLSLADANKLDFSFFGGKNNNFPPSYWSQII